MYAVSIKCAGPRPSTGYLAIPKKPGKYPASPFPCMAAAIPIRTRGVIHPVSGGGDKIAFYFSPHGYELSANRNIMTSFTARFAQAARRSVSTRSRTPIPDFLFQRLHLSPDARARISEVAARSGMAGTCASRAVRWAACSRFGRRVLILRSRFANRPSHGTATWAARYAQAHHRPLVHPRDTGPRYYDPVNLAKRIPKTCFVNVTRAGLGDYCCPPSGIWAMWNNLSCPKRIRWVRSSTRLCAERAARWISLRNPRNGGIGDCRMPENAFVVQNRRGYNSWPMIQAMGAKLVCTYSRDNALPPDGHATNPGSRDSYAKVSEDGGRTWSAEVTMASDPKIAG